LRLLPPDRSVTFYSTPQWFALAAFLLEKRMPEPTSSGVAGAAVAYKAFGGTAAAAASGATLAAVVVMLMTPPRNKREWAVGLISTVVSSIGGGAMTVEHFGLHHWAFSTMGLCALGGLIFACGLPGWAMVRWTFAFIDKRRDDSIDEVAKEVKGML
jgi:hypothetical protein